MKCGQIYGAFDLQNVFLIYNLYLYKYTYIMESEPLPRTQPVALDQNAALNNIVYFLNLAQKRGVFTFEESAKIWDCLKVFGAK